MKNGHFKNVQNQNPNILLEKRSFLCIFFNNSQKVPFYGKKHVFYHFSENKILKKRQKTSFLAKNGTFWKNFFGILILGFPGRSRDFLGESHLAKNEHEYLDIIITHYRQK